MLDNIQLFLDKGKLHTNVFLSSLSPFLSFSSPSSSTLLIIHSGLCRCGHWRVMDLTTTPYCLVMRRLSVWRSPATSPLSNDDSSPLPLSTPGPPLGGWWEWAAKTKVVVSDGKKYAVQIVMVPDNTPLFFFFWNAIGQMSRDMRWTLAPGSEARQRIVTGAQGRRINYW